MTDETCAAAKSGPAHVAALCARFESSSLGQQAADFLVLANANRLIAKEDSRIPSEIRSNYALSAERQSMAAAALQAEVKRRAGV